MIRIGVTRGAISASLARLSKARPALDTTTGLLHAYARGVEAGTAALVISLQPLFIAVIVGPLLGEHVTPKQWLGLLLGLGGVALVVLQKLGAGIGSPVGVGYVVLGLMGATAGTVYQKRFCSESDLRTSTTIQYAVATLAAGLLSLGFESQHT
jgi:drug/metabolite transporter (DMT)-like permease